MSTEGVSAADSGRFPANVEASTPSSSMKIVMKPMKYVQLDKRNYYSWEAQFSAMLRGFQLFDYVLGKVELSSPSSIQQDQLILRWKLTGISTTILPQVALRKTSAEVWDGLRRLYASGTQTRQLHIRLQLQSIRKRGLSMDEYIAKISILKNALASTGEGLKDSEIILITLGGLGNEFESFVTAITTV